jgi:hypothetical protein
MGATSPAPSDEGGRRRDWVWKVVVPIAVAVVGALLVGALTPIGDGLRELLFPTEVAVTGSAVVNGQPAAHALLTLDGEPLGEADETGAFLLMGVRAGTHELRIEAGGAYTRNLMFAVAQESTRRDLGLVELRPLVLLGFVVPWSLQEPSAFGQPPSVAYDLTLWIDAEPDVVNRIDSVTFTRPLPLPAAAVRGRSARNGFCYREIGNISADRLVGGAFTTATAVVVFSDGQSSEVFALPASVQPPNCPVKQGGSTGTTPSPRPSPMPSPSPTPRTSPPAETSPDVTMEVTVPDVICKSYVAATNDLESSGLVVKVGDPVSPLPQCPKSGLVAQQDPLPESVVAPGSVVVLQLGLAEATPSP